MDGAHQDPGCGLRRREWLAVLLLKLAYAAGFAVLFAGDPAEEFYDDLARNLLAGHGYVIRPGDAPSLYRPPGYPLLLAALFRTVGPALWPVFVLQVAFDLLTLGAVHGLVREWLGRPAARLAVLLCAAYPFFSLYSVRLLTESPFTLLLVAGLWALARAQRTAAVRDYAAAGLALGVAVLFRFSLFYFIPVAAAVAAPAAWRRTPGPRALAGPAALLAVALAAIAPWTARNYAVTGRFLLLGTGAGYNLWLGNHLPTDGRDNDELSGGQLALLQDRIREISGGKGRAFELENDARFAAAARAGMAADPAGTAGLVLRKGFRFWFEVFAPGRRPLAWALIPIQGALLALAAAGAVRALRGGRPVLWLLLPVAYFNALHAATVSTFRYSIPVMPLVLALVAHALAGVPWPAPLRRWLLPEGGAPS